jgi:class 3 adenylate cyclase
VAEVIGDGALVAFGLDAGGPEAAAAAIDFALAATRPAPGAPALRAGGHWGPVAVVDIGAGGRRRLTVSGDAVNVAARLQEMARAEPGRLLVSGALVGAAGPAAPAGLRPRGAVTLRGRAAALTAFAAP